MSSSSPALGDVERDRLARCVELAREAVDAGDQGFGSILVDATGRIRHEARNRVSGGDATRHPEFELARWAAEHLTPAERAAATVYTSGEHCPMCSAAHAWVGLGAIVIASSAAQFSEWMREWQQPDSPVAPLPIQQVAPGIEVRGPYAEFAEQLRAIHARALRIG